MYIEQLIDHENSMSKKIQTIPQKNSSFLQKTIFFEKYIFENFNIFPNKASMPIGKPTPITKWPNCSHAYLCLNNKPSIGNHHRPYDQMFGEENGLFTNTPMDTIIVFSHKCSA
jgi:hypothetical protein